MGEPGLRERKKQRTREAISRSALELFREAGFDAVSVVDVAAAAEVSKPTLFAYFPAKEDLVLHHITGHDDEPASVVRACTPGIPPLRALRRHYLDRLDRHDIRTGLDDTPEGLAVHQLLHSTPSLVARLSAHMVRSETALADALFSTAVDHDVATIVAAQVFGIQRVLSDRNAQEMRSGRSADEACAEAKERAEAAYDLLEHGVGGLGRHGQLGG